MDQQAGNSATRSARWYIILAASVLLAAVFTAIGYWLGAYEGYSGVVVGFVALTATFMASHYIGVAMRRKLRRKGESR